MVKRLFSLGAISFMVIFIHTVYAGSLYGTPSLWSMRPNMGASTFCGTDYSNVQIFEQPKFEAGTCNLNNIISQNYVPVSGMYAFRLGLIHEDGGAGDYTTTNYVWVDSSKPIGDQNLHFSGGGHNINPNLANQAVEICMYLTPDIYHLYIINGTSPFGLCNKNGYLLPGPPVPPISCKINNGNDLSVDLGILDREKIPTVPGSGQPQSAQFPVTCTGGAATMKMQLNYTPITVSGSQVVNSSINGLGVAVSYNDKILAPSDITTMQFPEGNTDVTLKFEAVRNPSVAVGDIKTGPFTASAVLVMTQQ
ncbi:fimbrial protein [Franconibacter daqui]|uniref:Fimbrial protein n=1 Tax=Franconibacter daqui TaxID=2047724 RepID=A0ABV1PTZ2_9ENTR